jgi:uncharacterized protein
MSKDIVDCAVKRIAEHAHRHHIPFITVIFHGGEPLLAGADLIGYAATAIRTAVPATTRVNLNIQTNGVLLTEQWLDLFTRYDIRVGVSLDGGAEDNDRHRVLRNGKGSYEAVSRALRLLGEERHRHRYSGILCTVDLRNDPLDVYRNLLAFRPPRLDFLLPHGNWTSPPPGRRPDSAETPYADWLLPIFAEWFRTTPQRVSVRLFESLIDLILGGRSGSEAVGLSAADLVTIETDGAIEYGDALKTTAEGMAATGLHVRSASFDDVLALPAFRSRQLGLAGLSAICRGCRLVHVCGGGLDAHRYRTENGFDNPSVYCPDLTALIDHVRDCVTAELRCALEQRGALERA